MKQYDAIIIGFGKGGKLLAAELAERNWKVAIVERSPQMYGGTCMGHRTKRFFQWSGKMGERF